ncbi:FemAB family XrtA/PEP-CTERM system-associated protein [uncultured Paraglaciecola sp.]|uniref:FemAB family XrtA/PEP-CTERM system-associated protein n=1 Tax=uncultured Paraglaciecola sp. TaxID=1765024 RepID=UPI0030D9DDB6|tara:strand:- start:89861 stop:90901 length:1041 start_codon:yes stop_codon:yes gene_type:complete
MKIRMAVAADHIIWDEYVDGHKDASPYHRFAWALSVQQAYQHQNVSLLALDNDKIVGVLPCVKMQNPFGKAKYCALPFCDLGFALGNDADIVKALQTEALTLLQNAKGTNFDYRDTATATESTELTGKKVRMVLPLPGSAETLLAGFKSKLRSQIRKAEKNGLNCKLANSQKHIDDFYQIFAINMRKLGSPVHSKKWFEALFNNYAKHIVLSVVYKDQVPVGAGIVLLNGTKAVIPWASTVAQYNKLAPNMLLYWSLLEHVSEHGCTEFDFGRSTYNEGTYKFKRQWGAEPIPLVWTNLVAQPATIDKNTPNKPSQIRSLIEKTWAILPLGVTTTLGPKIRKHISL